MCFDVKDSLPPTDFFPHPKEKYAPVDGRAGQESRGCMSSKMPSAIPAKNRAGPLGIVPSAIPERRLPGDPMRAKRIAADETRHSIGGDGDCKNNCEGDLLGAGH